VDRRQFAPELEKIFEQHYNLVYRTGLFADGKPAGR
jgi:hypothetical protein